MEDSYVLQLTNSMFRDLNMTYCGMSECKPGHTFGPAVRPNYIIHYVLSGKGVYQVGDQQYEIGKGQGFLIEPETLTFYKADEQNPWTYIWVGFSGEMASTYLSDIGLHSEQLVFQCDKIAELKQVTLKMLKHTSISMTDQYRLQSLLYQFFSILASGIHIDAVSGNSEESIYVREAVNYIRNNYFRGINVTDVADHIAVNRSYLYKLFQESFQMSPKDFLTQFRISRAEQLLSWSELSIESVAWSCGSKDALVFTKVFKKALGMPPSVYRKKHRKDIKELTVKGMGGMEEILEDLDEK